MAAKYSTGRIAIERLRYEDAEEMFYAYASKIEATKYVAWPTHKGIDETRDYIRQAITGWEQGIEYAFALRWISTRRLVGSFGLLNDSGRIQFGYILSPSQWGLGIATEVCRHMMGVLSSLKGVYRIGTFIDADNSASGRVLAKSGLEVEARLTKWFRFVNQNNEPKDCVLYRYPM